MTTRPVIFISAVSKELRSARDLVAKTLLALGYEPKWQDIAPTETGMLPEVLRKWIDESESVIQLVGHCYGFAPKEPDADFGACSYTQLEALYARKQGKPVYYILTDDNYPADSDASEPQDLHDLQEKYRQEVKNCGELYHTTGNLTHTELLVRRLKDDLAELRAEGEKQQRSLNKKTNLILGLIALLFAGGAWMYLELTRHDAKLLQAMRETPQALSQQPRTDAREDEATRIASAYGVLEKKLQLPPGSLARELPQFARDLLQRADTSAMDRANALFVIKKFAEAEAEALKAKDHALAAAGKPVQNAIDALRLAGQSAEAQIHYPQAMEHCRAAAALTSPERDVLQWLDVQNAISYLDYLQGHYPEGLAQTRQVWQTARQAGPAEAPAVLKAHMLYASALDDNGQAAAAEPEYRAVITAQSRVLGAEHPDTLKSRMNLAIVLETQGKLAEAEQEHQAVFQIRQRVLGPEHPDTLRSQNNLAEVLDDQGRHAEAEQKYREVLQLRESVLGPEHPSTLSSRMGLANALHSQQKHAAAEQEYRLVLQLRERVLSPEHPHVATTCYRLALCLEDQHKLPEALAFMQRAEQVRTKSLGPDHPRTQEAKAQRQRLEAALK